MLRTGPGLAVAATVAGLVASSGSPAYALTTNSDGTITLAIYQASGIAQANAKLHQLGDDVVVVPIRPGCPPLRPPVVSPKGPRTARDHTGQGRRPADPAEPARPYARASHS